MSGSGATVTLSIDLELAIGKQTEQGQERLEGVTAGLVDLLESLGMPATWGVSNPALSAGRDVILAGHVRHEIAVLGERFWLGDGTSPSRLAQEFQRRFEGARQAGLDVSTLLLRDQVERLDLNLLLGHGIHAVRGLGTMACDEDASLSAETMRFSIWQASHPTLIPLAGSWWQAEPWAFGQRLNQAVRAQRPLHLVLNAGKMADLSDLGMPAVSAVLQKLGQLQARGQVQIQTLGTLARQHLSRRSSRPSRSVLAA